MASFTPEEASMVPNAAQRSERTFGRMAQRLFQRLSRRRAEPQKLPRRSRICDARLGFIRRDDVSESFTSLGTGTDEIMGEVRDILSFNGNDSLLRGSALAEIMRCNASILSDSQGSAKTYKLSEPLREKQMLDCFISHNWVVPRRDKWVVLALHFNFDFAMMTTACILAGIVWYSGLVLCAISAVPTFLLMLYLRQDLGYILGFMGPKVFLDKTCIHQTSPELMRKGIEKLGAFLSNTKTMVVIYTDVYLQKLWTVYEIASFISLSDHKDIIMIPTFVPYVLLYVLAGTWVAALVMIFLESVVDREYLYLVVVVLHHGLLLPFSMYSHELADMLTRLEEFDVASCKCAKLSDRPVVHNNIASLMRALQVVSIEASLEECLAEFNGVVKTVLPCAVVHCLGKHLGIQYKHAVCVSFCVALPYLYDEWQCAGPITSMYCVYLSMVVGPLMIATTARICTFFHKPGCKGWVLKECAMLFVWSLLWLSTKAIEQPFLGCKATPRERDLILALMVIAMWIMGSLKLWLGAKCFKLPDALQHQIKGLRSSRSVTPSQTEVTLYRTQSSNSMIDSSHALNAGQQTEPVSFDNDSSRLDLIQEVSGSFLT